MSSILFGRKTVGEVYIRRFEVNEIPKSSEGSAEFLMDVYKAKDSLLDSYALTGSFTQENKFEEFPVTVMPRRIYRCPNLNSPQKFENL